MSLSKVLGATSRKDGYMEGGGWLVSWCVGHLVELAPADAYDPRYSKWAYDAVSYTHLRAHETSV